MQLSYLFKLFHSFYLLNEGKKNSEKKTGQFTHNL